MDPEGFEKLRTLFGSGVRATTAGFTARIERADRQADYRQAIRSGMINLVAAIVRNEPLEVTGEDGLRSLEVALRAT